MRHVRPLCQNEAEGTYCSEGRKTGVNLLMLCPSCHIMFDTHIKPKVYASLKQAGVGNLPKSWEKSIYQQAAEASQATRKNEENKIL